MVIQFPLSERAYFISQMNTVEKHRYPLEWMHLCKWFHNSKQTWISNNIR